MSANARVVGVDFVLGSDDRGKRVRDEDMADCAAALMGELGREWDSCEWWSASELRVSVYWTGAPLLHSIMERACSVYDRFLVDDV